MNDALKCFQLKMVLLLKVCFLFRESVLQLEF